MRDRVGDLQGADPKLAERQAHPGDPGNDAVSGLIALGYKPQEASKYVHGLDTEGLSSEEIIRQVLRSLVGP